MNFSKWFKNKLGRSTKTIAAVTMVAAMGISGTTPAYAQNTSVSAGFSGPLSGTTINGVSASRNIVISSFHSGSWRPSRDNPDETSPAWNRFAQEVSVDWDGTARGDVDKTFRVLAEKGVGIDRQACEVSSSIWVVHDDGYAGTKINLHRSWPMGNHVGNDPSKIASALMGADMFDPSTPDATNLAALVATISNHPSVRSQNFGDLKILCSYTFDPTTAEDTPDPGVYDTCIGDDCDPTTWSPPTPSPDDFVDLCTTGEWQSTKYNRARPQPYAGTTDFNDWLEDELEHSSWGPIIASLGFSALALREGNWVDQSVAWRCNQRFMTYYQAAPATYHTEVALGEVTSPIDNNIYNNVFRATTENSNGYKSDSDLANAWYDGMHLAGYVDDVDQAGLLKITESPRTLTEYGKVWNNLTPRPSNGTFDAFYDLGDEITTAVNQDKTNGNFSSGTNLTLAQMALLGNGGIVNVQEKERTKIIRIAQPYYEIEVSKCTAFGSAADFLPPPFGPGTGPSCNPIPTDTRPLSNEKIDLTLTDPNLLTLDQAQYVINRTANLIMEPNSISSTVEGFTNVLKVLDGNGQEKLNKCVEGVEQRTNEVLDVNLVDSDNFIHKLNNMLRVFNEIRSGINNVTLPCQDILTNLNPDQGNRILGILENIGEDFAYFANPLVNNARFSRAYVSPENPVVIQRAQFDPETVSWWQAISVNCNLSGFEQLVATTGSTVLSNEVSDISSAYHNVAQSPIVYVDRYDDSTLFRSDNLFYGRPGTPSYYSNFFDKECPFGCVSSNNPAFGATIKNDAINNTPDGSTSGSSSYGAQIRDVGNVSAEGDIMNAEISNTGFINIFRDNIVHRIRTDVWYPTNAVGQIASQAEEIKNIISNGDILGFLTDAPKFVNTIDMMQNSTGSFGILYDGSAPSTTTITRFKEGTPEIGEFFKVKAVTSPTETVDGELKLDATTGETVEIFEKGTNTSIPSQKANSHDVLPGTSVGSETAAILPDLVNEIDVSSQWASEKSKPQVFNFKWEYQVPSLFFSIGSAGFDRTGTQDQEVNATNRLSLMFTILEGKCYAMFGTEIGKNTFGVFNSTTGSGVPNTLDNGNGVLSGSASEEYEENLIVNTLRAVGE